MWLYDVACNFATIGEVTEALDFLKRAIEYGVVNAAWMRNDADLDPLRSDLRFQALLQQAKDRQESTQ